MIGRNGSTTYSGLCSVLSSLQCFLVYLCNLIEFIIDKTFGMTQKA